MGPEVHHVEVRRGFPSGILLRWSRGGWRVVLRCVLDRVGARRGQRRLARARGLTMVLRATATATVAVTAASMRVLRFLLRQRGRGHWPPVLPPSRNARLETRRPHEKRDEYREREGSEPDFLHALSVYAAVRRQIDGEIDIEREREREGLIEMYEA